MKINLSALLLFTILLPMNIGSIKIDPQIAVLQTELNKKNDHIVKLTKELVEVKAENVRLVQNKYDDAIALEPSRFITERHNTSDIWCRNIDHMKQVWTWIKEYEYLLTDETRKTVGNVNIRFEVFCGFFSESKFNPKVMTYNYKEADRDHYLTRGGLKVDKKYFNREIYYENLIFLSNDYGMGQYNDCVWADIIEHLPEKLKKRNNIRFDPEVSVAAAYIWRNHRVEIHMSWMYLSPEAWTLMYRLNRIKG